MKNVTRTVILAVALMCVYTADSQSVLNPADPVVNFNVNNPPTQPPPGQIGKWVRTPRNFWWNADVYKAYIYNGYAFRLKFPKTYNPTASDGKKYPMLVFFHGYGEIGPNTDNEFHLLHGAQGFAGAVDNGTFDGYVLFMQSEGFFHGGHYNAIVDIINYMIQNNKLDPFDIVANGLSSGGEATWSITINHPTYISAALPMSWCQSNYADANTINKLKATPIWIFQGGLDYNPPPSTTRSVRDAYLAQGGNFRYTEYPEADHTTWYHAWGEPDFWPFLNKAYSSNPWPLYGKHEFLPNEAINATLMLAPGFSAYQWRKDGVVITTATSNTLSVTQLGTYDARVQRNGIWSDWSRVPVVVRMKPTTNLPGRVEAENWAAMKGIQTEPAWGDPQGGGLNVGWVDNGDWLDYIVNSPSASGYTLKLRVASPHSNSQLQIRKEDGTVLTTVNVPNTGGWQSWQTITTNISLAAGYQTIRVISTASNGWNLNWLEFTQGSGNQPPTANAGPDKTVTLPTNSVTLNGSGADPDGTITYAWSKVSGPTGSTFSNANAATTSVNGLVQGTYVFRLTVTDNNGASATDDVIVTVNNSTSNYVTIPAKIEAENYTAMNGVLTEATSDAGGGQNVGWMDNGDWMDYNVNASTSGVYSVKFRVASNATGAQFQLRKTDGTVLTTVNVPNTGGWQNWQTVTANINLAAGSQTLRILSTTWNGWNINWLEFTTGGGNVSPTANAGADVTITLPASSVTLNGSGSDMDGTITAYSWSKVSGPASGTFSSTSVPNPTVSNLTQGTYVFRLTVTDNGGATGTDDVTVTVNPSPSGYITLPAKIEAEHYTAMNGVLTESTSDAGGGQNLGWIDNGDWMDYNVNVPTAGTWTIKFRLAAGSTGAQFQVRKSDGTVLSTINVPGTGGWQNWQTVATTVSLSAGNQTIRLYSTTWNGWNINWLEFTQGVGGTANLLTDVQIADRPFETEQIIDIFPNPVQDQFTLRINNNSKGNMKVRILNMNGALQKEVNLSKQQQLLQTNISIGNLPRGQYLLILEMNGVRETRKLTRL